MFSNIYFRQVSSAASFMMMMAEQVEDHLICQRLGTKLYRCVLMLSFGSPNMKQEK
jgi:hypothetical protein